MAARQSSLSRSKMTHNARLLHSFRRNRGARHEPFSVISLSSESFLGAMERVLDRFDSGELHIVQLAVHLFDPADVFVLDDARVSGSIAICPRGLSQLIPFIAAMRVSPSALPLIFSKA